MSPGSNSGTDDFGLRFPGRTDLAHLFVAVVSCMSCCVDVTNLVRCFFLEGKMSVRIRVCALLTCVDLIQRTGNNIHIHETAFHIIHRSVENRFESPDDSGLLLRTEWLRVAVQGPPAV